MDLQLICNVLLPVIIVGLVAWLWNDMKALREQRDRASQWMHEAGSERTAKESYKYQLEAEKKKVQVEKSMVKMLIGQRDKLFEACKQKDLNLKLANESIEQLEQHIDSLQASPLNKQKEAILKQAKHWKERWQESEKALEDYRVFVINQIKAMLFLSCDIDRLQKNAKGYYKKEYEQLIRMYNQLSNVQDCTVAELAHVKQCAEDLVNAIQSSQYPEELDPPIQKLLPFFVEYEPETTPEPVTQTEAPPDGEAESA